MAANLAADPEASLPQAHNGWAELTGSYRLLHNDAVDPQDVLEPHRRLTREAIRERGDEVVLCVQDTTNLDFTGREVDGLAEIGNGGGRGMLQHAGLAVTEDGEVLGLLHGVWHNRVKVPKGETRKQRRQRPTMGDYWAEVAAGIGPVEGTRLCHVGDRLADVFGFMQTCSKLGHGWVIRAQHNRKVDDRTLYLQDKLDSAPVSATRKIPVPRRGNQKAREAQVAVRWCTVTVPWPKNGPDDRTPLEGVAAVEVFEPDPPAGVEPLRWLLLTSEPVACEADAWLAVERYRKRWVIEEWHKAIKSGCKLERCQLKDAMAIRRLAAVAAVVAVRLMQLRDAASASSQRGDAAGASASSGVFTCPLEDAVWVRVVAAKAGVPPEEVDAAVVFETLARHGGHLGRKHDPRPGWQCLWKGYRKISLMVEGARCVEG